MKKIVYFLCAMLFVVCSCNLDIPPTSSISTESALQKVEDAQKFRRDMYVTMRDYLCSGSPVYLMELMGDSFHASITFGNRNGEYYKWEMRSTFGNVESVWQYSYYCVMLANFLETGIPKMADISPSDYEQLDIILGECAFVKAYSMFTLTEIFCQNYNAATASSDYGVMLSSEVFGTPSEPSTYPGRSSLAETYSYIETNLTKAESLLANQKGNVGSIYITIDAVKALQARIALTKGDYVKAASIASSLVDNKAYPLVSDLDEFNNLWTNDSGKECIVQFWADYLSTPNSNCYDYVGLQSNGTYSPNYIPEKWVIDAFDAKDIRMKSWFFKTPVVFGTINSNLYICNKFPGNPELMPGVTISTYLNKIKPFRIAEQYLIAAEAYANSGDAASACTYLNALRKSRIPGYTAKSYSGDELISQIKLERAKELYGEGFRYKDLKRWGEGMSRSIAQDSQVVNGAGSATTELMSRTASDPFFIWPIPQAEIDSNPQIRNQQNQGY